MSDEIETQRLLGRLIEGQERARDEVSAVRRMVESLAHLPQQMTNHEAQDERRFGDIDSKMSAEHVQNTETLEKIAADVGILKTDRDMRRGARALAHALSAAIGAAVAALATLLRLKGGS